MIQIPQDTKQMTEKYLIDKGGICGQACLAVIENTNNTEQGKPRSGITITDVKVVGNCSKHRKENEEPSKDIYGRVYDDNELVCIECNLQDNHEQSSEPTGLNSSDD